MRIPEYGAKLEAALTKFLHQEQIRFRRPFDEQEILRVVEVARAGPKRLRAISETGHGRGTGRGRKEPAAKLTRPLKWTGKRAEFVKYIGGKETGLKAVGDVFKMSRPNINGFLTNIHRDHGIGYEKDHTSVRLLLPKGATWSNIWEAF